ncbi:low-density lipoprotein receptor-related protein 4-like [Magallana gigas]|uniref:low-density lipoprotein receptor-related protein 4-like n=1 Tax=Magallana gigas TaxID=29159 RepID=UPI003340FA18
MKPAYTHVPHMYKVVVQDNIRRPEGLILDPLDGYMFFSDKNPNCRITRASLNGDNTTVIVYKGLIYVPTLSIDPDNKMIYFADTVRDTIEVCDYDGSNRRVIRRTNLATINAIQYYESAIYTVGIPKKQVRGFNSSSGKMMYSMDFTLGTPWTVTVYDSENLQNFSNPCSSKQCEQICVNTPAGPSCLCYEEFDLALDGISCNSKSLVYSKGFVISSRSAFVMIDILNLNSNDLDVTQRLDDPSAYIQSFIVDATNERIYYIDSKNRVLKQLDIKTKKIHTLTNIGTGKDLVLDWHLNLLGWIDVESFELVSFNLSSGNLSTIYSSLFSEESFTVDPNTGTLFWISGTPPSLIKTGSWNKSSPRTLITSAELAFPKAIYYDVTDNRLYWLDGSLIKSCLNNGSDIVTHSLATDAQKLISFKEYFVWMTAKELYYGLKSTNTFYKSLDMSEVLQNMSNLVVYDPYLQNSRAESCHVLNGQCGDICIPQQDTHTCTCDLGLQLQNDSTSCDSTVFDSNFMLLTDLSHDRMIQVDIDTGTLVKLPFAAIGATGIAYEKLFDTIFFTSTVNTFTSKVMSVSLHGKKGIVTYATGFHSSESIAIDYSTSNLYYAVKISSTSSGQDMIRVVQHATFLEKTLLTNLKHPRDIALYPSKGLMFWVEVENPKIGKAAMDGTSKESIVTSDITWPNGIAIDYTSERLYWTEGYFDWIESSDINGEDRKKVLSDPGAHLRSIFVDSQFIYYTGYNRQRVVRINKTSEAEARVMKNYPELGVIGSVKVYTDNDIVDVNPLCAQNNGLCSTFCFPTPSGRTCGCQDNVKLLSDQRTCEGVPVCPTSLPSLQLLNCVPYPGESCEFKCMEGFKRILEVNVTCDSLGLWNPETETLCSEILCSSSLPNAALTSGCSRRIGESCGITCKEYYSPLLSDDIICSENGEWQAKNISNSTEFCEPKEFTNESDGDQLTIGLSTGVGGLVLIIIIIIVIVICLKRMKTRKRMQREAEDTIKAYGKNQYITHQENAPEEDTYATLDEMNFKDLGYMEFDKHYDPDVYGGFVLDAADEYLKPSVERKVVDNDIDEVSEI